MGCGKPTISSSQSRSTAALVSPCLRSLTDTPVGSDKRIECDGFVTRRQGPAAHDLYCRLCAGFAARPRRRTSSRRCTAAGRAACRISSARRSKKCARSAQSLQSIRAAIGASIGKCCFECDDDVPCGGGALSRRRDRTDFSRKSPTGKRMSICAAQMHADL